jgi:hypothetical protein
VSPKPVNEGGHRIATPPDDGGHLPGRAPWQTHAMQIGVVYPQIELGGDPAAVRRFGRAVEDLGFDYLLAYDHVLGAVHADRTPPLTGPYTEHDPFHDPSCFAVSWRCR